MPDSVRIELSEIERAHKMKNDYYLAVVSGLEEGYDHVTIKLFATPLSTLDWQHNTIVSLSGVRKKHALEIII